MLSPRPEYSGKNPIPSKAISICFDSFITEETMFHLLANEYIVSRTIVDI